jgi:hypothetical protein
VFALKLIKASCLNNGIVKADFCEAIRLDDQSVGSSQMFVKCSYFFMGFAGSG